MNRKWAVLAATALTAALVVTGLTTAADDDSPLHKIMEKVQSNNATITKGIRNPAMFKKSQKDIAKAAEELVKLGKESKPLTDEAKKAKGITGDPVKKWEGYSDAFVAEAEKFAELVGKADTDQPKAKDAFKAVSKSCANCHADFRKDED